MKGKKEAVVKIDSELLAEIDSFIKKKENKLRYSGKKQFVDIAVFLLLEKEQNTLHIKERARGGKK